MLYPSSESHLPFTARLEDACWQLLREQLMSYRSTAQRTGGDGSSNRVVAGTAVCTSDNVEGLRPSHFHVRSACICFFRQVLKHLELKKYFSCTHKISHFLFDRVIEASKQPYNDMK